MFIHFLDVSFPQQLTMCDSFTSHFWKGASSASFSDFLSTET